MRNDADGDLNGTSNKWRYQRIHDCFPEMLEERKHTLGAVSRRVDRGVQVEYRMTDKYWRGRFLGFLKPLSLAEAKNSTCPSFLLMFHGIEEP